MKISDLPKAEPLDKNSRIVFEDRPPVTLGEVIDFVVQESLKRVVKPSPGVFPVVEDVKFTGYYFPVFTRQEKEVRMVVKFTNKIVATCPDEETAEMVRRALEVAASEGQI